MTDSERTDAVYWALLGERDPRRQRISELNQVHLSPDRGIQAYSKPYPDFRGSDSTRGGYIPGRSVLHVLAIRGDWVYVTVQGDAIGWVTGRQLVPPVSGTTARCEREAVTSARRSFGATVSILVGVLAGSGVVIGALIDWKQGSAVNSFKVPTRFLFDMKTTSLDPRLGYLVVAIGLLGVFVSFFPHARVLRVLLGSLASLAAVLYCGQVASEPSSTRGAFANTIGPGPWVTGIAGIVLAASALLRWWPPKPPDRVSR